MDVATVLPSLDQPGWRGWLRDSLNFLLGLHQPYHIFQGALEKRPTNVFLGVLEEMKMVMDHGPLDGKIPASGGAVMIANHPFGGADAIALSAFCIRKRPDTKILANAVTAELPGAEKWMIPLQILGQDGAIRSNRAAMKEAFTHLRSGGVLVVFPSGAVSRWRNDLARVADPEWSQHVARLATKTGAPVVPVKFFDRNPDWYEVLGALHPIMHTAMIVRVFLGSRGRTIRFRGGERIEADVLQKFANTVDATDYLRNAVDAIGEP